VRLSSLSGHAGSALVGVVVGALVVLAADGLTRAPTPGPEGRRLPVVDAAPDATSSPGRVLLAWSPGGLPIGTERALESMPAVRHATTVFAGLDWLTASHAPDGAPIDAPQAGLSIPLEVAVIEPREYAPFVPAAERDAVLALAEREALLARTEAGLRGSGEGLRLRLTDRSVVASGVVSDLATNGYEALVRGPVPAGWTRADRFVILRLRHARGRHVVERRLQDLLGPGQVLRVRSQRETPYLRYADAVQPQMIIKESFGEFAARPRADGTIAIDPAWVRRNIVRGHVPVLGEISCHRALFPQLREALQELVDDGLAYLIDPDQYAGCYSPRFIDRQPGGRLSHHAWGIAIDLNWRDNAFGTRPDQDRRLVERMEQWGFTWGGRWLIPDGMHFEWNRWP
jgi:hypothetical protein